MLNVKLIILDVDGTLTDGTIGYSDDGTQTKRFHVADGLGIVMAQAVGLKIAVVSGRASQALETRMAELRVTELVLGCGDKAAAVSALLAKYELSPSEAAFVGDDLNDLPAFGAVGVKIAVADASEIIKAVADWVTPRPGGRGAVRDAIDEILRRQGRLEDAARVFLENARQAAGPIRQ